MSDHIAFWYNISKWVTELKLGFCLHRNLSSFIVQFSTIKRTKFWL